MLAASHDHPMVVVDLSGTSFSDSGGISVLLRAWRRCRADGGELLLVGVNVRRVLAAMGLDRLFASYAGVDEALRSLVSR